MSETLSNTPEGAENFKAPQNTSKVAQSERFRTPELERPLTVEESLDKFEHILKTAQSLVFATDLDGTVLPFAQDPRDCKVDPLAKDSLVRLQNSGIPIVVMTGRSGADGAAKIEVPGSIIVGTAGWEVYKTDPNNPSQGESIIDEQFQPHSQQITNLLGGIRNEFLT